MDIWIYCHERVYCTGNFVMRVRKTTGLRETFTEIRLMQIVCRTNKQKNYK